MNTPELFSYLADDNIWLVNIFADTRFSTARQVAGVFAQTRRYWQSHIAKRCYALIDYTGTHIDKAAAAAFADERQRIVAECTLATLRFTTDLEARTAIRAISIKIHQPSNLYASKEEAMEVVRRIRSGQVGVADEPGQG